VPHPADPGRRRAIQQSYSSRWFAHALKDGGATFIADLGQMLV